MVAESNSAVLLAVQSAMLSIWLSGSSISQV
jgi:hypothetical protein